MKHMSGFEILKLLEGLDKEYLSRAKTSDNVPERKFCTKAHFVIGRIRDEFKKKLAE